MRVGVMAAGILLLIPTGFGHWVIGANVVGALQLAQELGPGHTVVTVAVDTGLKYLAGELYRE